MFKYLYNLILFNFLQIFNLYSILKHYIILQLCIMFRNYMYYSYILY